MLVHSFSGNEGEITAEPARSAMLGLPNVALVCPHLFGPAGNPNTCGSPAQLARLNDVIAWMRARYGASLPVFFSGVSGGHGLGATFIGAYPDVVQGASLWCGYHDLAQWYAESVTAGHVYDDLMLQTFGGDPAALPAAYLAQSPKGALSGARNCAVFINDGLLDTEILPHHRQDMCDQLLALPSSAGVICSYIGYPAMGHAVDYAIVAGQINTMRAALG